MCTHAVGIFCIQSLAVQPEVCSFPSKFAFGPSAVEEKQLRHVVLSDLTLGNGTFSRPGGVVFICLFGVFCHSEKLK